MFSTERELARPGIEPRVFRSLGNYSVNQALLRLHVLIHLPPGEKGTLRMSHKTLSHYTLGNSSSLRELRESVTKVLLDIRKVLFSLGDPTLSFSCMVLFRQDDGISPQFNRL